MSSLSAAPPHEGALDRLALLLCLPAAHTPVSSRTALQLVQGGSTSSSHLLSSGGLEPGRLGEDAVDLGNGRLPLLLVGSGLCCRLGCRPLWGLAPVPGLGRVRLLGCLLRSLPLALHALAPRSLSRPYVC